MALPRLTLKNGSFLRSGERFVPFGPVYFARRPGTCGGDYFADEFWPDAKEHFERDFARIASLGCTWVVPFVKTTPFWKDGKPVEKVWKRHDHMVEAARRNGLYCVPFPNAPNEMFPAVMGRPYANDPAHPHKHPATNPQIHDMTVEITAAFARRYDDDTAVPLGRDSEYKPGSDSDD